MPRKIFYNTCCILIFLLGQAAFLSCTKEYSYEGGPSAGIPPVPDTTVIISPPATFPDCDICRQIDNSQLSTWSFTYNSSQFCGTVTNTVVTPQRNGFTFFGPSACSKDTGVVFTVFLDPESLTSDKTALTTNQVIFQFYDNTARSDIFISTRLSVSLTIDTYNHTTGIAQGRFLGNVETKDSTVGQVMDGKFSIKFPI